MGFVPRRIMSSTRISSGNTLMLTTPSSALFHKALKAVFALMLTSLAIGWAQPSSEPWPGGSPQAYPTETPVPTPIVAPQSSNASSPQYATAAASSTRKYTRDPVIQVGQIHNRGRQLHREQNNAFARRNHSITTRGRKGLKTVKSWITLCMALGRRVEVGFTPRPVAIP